MYGKSESIFLYIMSFVMCECFYLNKKVVVAETISAMIDTVLLLFGYVM